jgi:hypothetical protein
VTNKYLASKMIWNFFISFETSECLDIITTFCARNRAYELSRVVKTLKISGINGFWSLDFLGSRPLPNRRQVVNYSNRRQLASGQFGCAHPAGTHD